MKNITLTIPGLKEMDENETLNTTGGLFWIPATVLIAIAISAVSNFGDIRHGFSDGWSGLPPRYLN